MKVKDLIKMLMDCDPEATVFVEANDVPILFPAVDQFVCQTTDSMLSSMLQ